MKIYNNDIRRWKRAIKKIYIRVTLKDHWSFQSSRNILIKLLRFNQIKYIETTDKHIVIRCKFGKGVTHPVYYKLQKTK